MWVRMLRMLGGRKRSCGLECMRDGRDGVSKSALGREKVVGEVPKDRKRAH